MTGGTTDGLLTAGRFAQSTLLSAKALRIYADRGLLAPHVVDPANGHRRYHPDQVRTGWTIALLRTAGLSLDEIGGIVHADAEDALARLERSAATLERRTAANLAVLRRVRLHLREEHDMAAVTTTVVPDRPVLSVLRRMRPDEMATVIPAELVRLRAAAADAGLTETGRAFGIFHRPITDDSDGPLEITLPVDDLTDLTGDIRSYRLPGGAMATREAIGEETWFPAILARYDEVRSWITDAGRSPIGPPREIWHNSPHDSEPLRLTIAWPYLP